MKATKKSDSLCTFDFVDLLKINCEQFWGILQILFLIYFLAFCYCCCTSTVIFNLLHGRAVGVVHNIQFITFTLYLTLFTIYCCCDLSLFAIFWLLFFYKFTLVLWKLFFYYFFNNFVEMLLRSLAYGILCSTTITSQSYTTTKHISLHYFFKI